MTRPSTATVLSREDLDSPTSPESTAAATLEPTDSREFPRYDEPHPGLRAVDLLESIWTLHVDLHPDHA